MEEIILSCRKYLRKSGDIRKPPKIGSLGKSQGLTAVMKHEAPMTLLRAICRDLPEDAQRLASDVERALSALTPMQSDTISFDVALLVCMAVEHSKKTRTSSATNRIITAAAERYRLYDTAILLAADGLELKPTRKFCESLLGEIWIYLAETNLPERYRRPSFQTIARRIEKILQTDEMDMI